MGINRNNTLLAWICVVIIALITYIVFSPSLSNDFTNWDDNYYVTVNPLVVTNTVPVVKIFETPVSRHYHPLTILSLALNYHFGKFNPMGYHLTNVLLHVLNTILVFLFIFLLTRRNLLMAALVALFFGIHPMHVESVTWISERKDVLYVFFFMAGLISYLRYCETKKITWYIATLLLFILSCLSKEVAVVFPVILLLTDYLSGVKWEKRVWMEKIPFFILSLVVGIAEIKIQSGNTSPDMIRFTFFQRVLYSSYAAIQYLVKLFAPYKLSAYYPYPGMNNGIPLKFYFFPFILLGLAAVLIYCFMKGKKEIVFGLLFYFTTIALILQMTMIPAGITPDRNSYLAYVGLLFIVAYMVNRAWESREGALALMKYPLIIIAATGAVVFSFQTYARAQVWKNSVTLWTNVIDNYPDAYLAYYNRSLYYYSINDAKDETPDLYKTIKLNPQYSYAYISRGLLYFNEGKPDSALADDNKAIALDTTLADPYNNRALVYDYYNKKDLALADLNKAIAKDNTYIKSYSNRAMLYHKYGRDDLAVADFSKIIEIAPHNANAYNYRGEIYSIEGKNDLAFPDFNKAIALDSVNGDTYYNRGTLYYNSNKYDLALADYTKAIRFNPANSFYYYCRGLCYYALNLYEKAADDFTRGIQLKPGQVELYYNLRGKCNFYLQNYTEAIADYSKAIEANPSVPDYWLNRSFIEGKIGQNESAEADVLKGKQLYGK